MLSQDAAVLTSAPLRAAAIALLLIPCLRHGSGSAAEAPQEESASAPVPAPADPGSPRAPSPKLQDALRLVDTELSATQSGRRLLVQTAEFPVLERARTGMGPVRFVFEDKPGLLVDSEIAPKLTALEFELFFVRERRRALIRSPFPLMEEEQALHQAAIEYAVEKAALSPEFSKSLRGACEEARRFLRARAGVDAAAVRAGLPPLPRWREPRTPLDFLARHLVLYSEDPYAFYGAVEDALEHPPETVRLQEVEDLLSLYGAVLDGLKWRAEGRYCMAGERLYSGRVCRAARALRDRDGLARLKEGLGPFQSAQREELRAKVNRWFREEK